MFEVDVIFSVDDAYPETEPLLPLEIEIRERYGVASVAGLSLGIELDKKPRSMPPLVVVRKPVRLGRAKFDHLGSKTTVVFEHRKTVEEVDDIVEATAKRENALGVIIGMPDVEHAVNDADLMRRYFQNSLGIRGGDIKVYTHGMNRNEFVSLFDQKIGHAVGPETDLFVFYAGGGTRPCWRKWRRDQGVRPSLALTTTSTTVLRSTILR